MILHKFWSAFVAQINKVANLFWEADPVAQMRYEYDRAVEQLKEGRGGLEQYRGLVERGQDLPAGGHPLGQRREPGRRAGHERHAVAAPGQLVCTDLYTAPDMRAAGFEVYDPGARTWRRLAPLPGARGGTGAAALGGRGRVIISTGTKNLQEQLMEKDIPFLQDVLPAKFRAAVMKGRNNYACLHRIKRAESMPVLEGLDEVDRAVRLGPVLVERAACRGRHRRARGRGGRRRPA